MKIFAASQIRACDAYTTHALSITSTVLMERAAEICADWLITAMPKDSVFLVLCGTGNNGGDGLAITRLLHNAGMAAKAFVLMVNKELSDDCRINLERLQHIDKDIVGLLEPDSFITDIPSNIIIIDAILGTGLNRDTEGWVAKFIQYINQLPNKKISIDIPSGMPADTIPGDDASILCADVTLSFQFYKRSFLHPETGRFAGDIHILDIGLHKTFIDSTHTNYQTIDLRTVRELYKPRNRFSHKGDYGYAFVIGGSYGMCGAIALTAKAALRAGAGKVKAIIPECGYVVLQTAVPEAMCATKGEKFVTSINGWNEATAIGVGPGLGMQEYTARAFVDFIETCKQPVVLDADALNLLAKQPELKNKIPNGSILTPHPKEFERLFGASSNSMQQLELARTQAMRYNVYIILKGHYTAVITPEGECWYNMSGNAGMATGGSGDVLTGILVGLLAQGYTSLESALLGVYLHGLAGDIAAANISQEALIAGDIIEYLGKAFLSIH